jgi:hypothetical protein
MAKVSDDTVNVETVEEAAAEIVRSSATDVVGAIQGLNNPESAFYSSIKGTDFNARKAVAAALTSSTPIDESMGQTIQLVNFIVQPVDLVDDDSGEVTTAPRVILIDDEGKAYHATSVGLLSSVRNIVSVLGEPSDWPEPVAVRVEQQKGRNGFKFFTIKFV